LNIKFFEFFFSNLSSLRIELTKQFLTSNNHADLFFSSLRVMTDFSCKFDSNNTCTDYSYIFCFVDLLGESSKVVLAGSDSINSVTLNWVVVGEASTDDKDIEVKSSPLSIRLNLNQVCVLLYVKEATLQELEFACITLGKVSERNYDLVLNCYID